MDLWWTLELSPLSLPLVHHSLHEGGCSVRRDHPLHVSLHGTPSVEAGEGACTLRLDSLYLGVPLSVWHWLLALLIQYNDLHFFINCAQLIFFLLSWQWSESNHSCDFCISLPESFEVPLIYNCTKCMTYRMSKCDLLLHRSS